MKTTWYSMTWLGLAAICLGLATPSPAAKGGNPGKPGGGEDPPSEPELPFTYKETSIAADPPYYVAYSINDDGVVAGEYETQTVNSPVYAFTLAPNMVEGEIVYQSGSAITLAGEVVFDEGISKINNAGLVAGTYLEPYARAQRAILWMQDGTGVDLGVTASGINSECKGINDAGLVVILTEADNSYVVLPLDTDAVPGPDTWLVDANADGINDLLYPIATGLTPAAINSSGQIVFGEGYVLTPDFSVLSTGENPWQDGSAILQELAPLTGFEEAYTRAFDINDAGVVVGTSNGRAVIWEDVNNPDDLGQPTKQSNEIRATHINNAGQIFGWCRDKRWGRSYFLIHQGQMYDLVEMGGTHAVDINNYGWIIDLYGHIYIPVYPEP